MAKKTDRQQGTYVDGAILQGNVIRISEMTIDIHVNGDMVRQELRIGDQTLGCGDEFPLLPRFTDNGDGTVTDNKYRVKYGNTNSEL